uniref:Micro-fibrillar-associated protein 1 C-terminal domain-containing protein n=2 Tax=Lygus hesperus TaxID=30085 RepID=A0A0A9YCD5_LYGHE
MDDIQRKEYLQILQQRRLQLLQNTRDPFLTNVKRKLLDKDVGKKLHVERQRGFHKGAYFVDEESNYDNLFDRDFSQATGLDALYLRVGKSNLPDFMKDTNFGTRKRSKYQGIRAMDTSLPTTSERKKYRSLLGD